MDYFVQILGLPFLACVIMIFIFGYLGLHILKREIIFIDIALAQIAAVGVVMAHLIFGAHKNSLIGISFVFSLTLVTAIFYAYVRKKVKEIPLEAVIGISYAISAALALFLIGIIPGGHLHIEHMLAGSILWVTWKEIVHCILVFSLIGYCFFLLRKPFEKISNNYDNALRDKMNVIWWDFLFYVLVGIVIAVSVQISGVVLVFAFLIIPATISALFSANWIKRLVIAWAVGIIASASGLLFASYFDFSVGTSVSLFLGIILIAASIYSFSYSQINKKHPIF